MSVQKKIESLLDANKIHYFKGNSENNNILSLPYLGIKDRSNRLTIYLLVDEADKSVRFTFAKQCNKDMAVAEVKSQLLDINFSLESGSLSMKNDSDMIEYRVDVSINDDFSFEEYNRYIVRSIKTFELLKDKALVE